MKRLSYDENPLSKSSEQRRIGNEHFQNGQYCCSLRNYTEAISTFPNEVNYCNRSCSYLELRRYHRSVYDAKESIRINQRWWKGYYRLSVGLLEMKRYSQANMVLRKAKSLCPRVDGRGTRMLKKLSLKISNKQPYRIKRARYHFMDNRSRKKLPKAFEMVRALDMDELRNMIEENKDVLKTKTHRGDNLLHAACLMNDPRIIKFLLPEIDVTTKNKNGFTPLGICVIWDCVRSFETIMEYLKQNNRREKIIEMIVDEKNSSHISLLFRCINKDQIQILSRVTSVLTELRYDLSKHRISLHTNEEKRNLMMIACERGALRCFKHLLHLTHFDFPSRRVFHINEPSPVERKTALHLLAYGNQMPASFLHGKISFEPTICKEHETDCNHAKIARVLLSQGADMSLLSSNGRTAFLEACYHGHYQLVKCYVNYDENRHLYPLPVRFISEEERKYANFGLLSESDDDDFEYYDNNVVRIESAESEDIGEDDDEEEEEEEEEEGEDDDFPNSLPSTFSEDSDDEDISGESDRISAAANTNAVATPGPVATTTTTAAAAAAAADDDIPGVTDGRDGEEEEEEHDDDEEDVILSDDENNGGDVANGSTQKRSDHTHKTTKSSITTTSNSSSSSSSSSKKSNNNSSTKQQQQLEQEQQEQQRRRRRRRRQVKRQETPVAELSEEDINYLRHLRRRIRNRRRRRRRKKVRRRKREVSETKLNIHPGLFLSCYNGHLNVVKYLIRKYKEEYSMSRVDELSGATCLYVATARQFPELVSYLLKSGADPNQCKCFSAKDLQSRFGNVDDDFEDEYEVLKRRRKREELDRHGMMVNNHHHHHHRHNNTSRRGGKRKKPVLVHRKKDNGNMNNNNNSNNNNNNLKKKRRNLETRRKIEFNNNLYLHKQKILEEEKRVKQLSEKRLKRSRNRINDAFDQIRTSEGEETVENKNKNKNENSNNGSDDDDDDDDEMEVEVEIQHEEDLDHEDEKEKEQDDDDDDDDDEDDDDEEGEVETPDKDPYVYLDDVDGGDDFRIHDKTGGVKEFQLHPFTGACVSGNYTVVKSFMDHGVDLSRLSIPNPFISAIRKGRVKVVSLMLTYPGVEILQKDLAGLDGLYYSCMAGNLTMIKLIVTIIERRYGEDKAISEILRERKELRHDFDDDMSCLQACVNFGHQDCFDFLIQFLKDNGLEEERLKDLLSQTTSTLEKFLEKRRVMASSASSASSSSSSSAGSSTDSVVSSSSSSQQKQQQQHHHQGNIGGMSRRINRSANYISSSKSSSFGSSYRKKGNSSSMSRARNDMNRRRVMLNLDDMKLPTTVFGRNEHQHY